MATHRFHITMVLFDALLKSKLLINAALNICLLGHVFYVAWISLTWLLDDKQDGLAAGVLKVLETLHEVILVFVSAIHSVCIVEHCEEIKRTWFINEWNIYLFSCFWCDGYLKIIDL